MLGPGASEGIRASAHEAKVNMETGSGEQRMDRRRGAHGLFVGAGFAADFAMVKRVYVLSNGRRDSSGAGRKMV